MPEIKRNFTKGKMNKDLDERLVPLGEYRDAQNVQVSTSEESKVGALQNILGNTPGCTYDNSNINPIPDGSITVGSISDEKNDTLYWLVSGYNTEVPPDWTTQVTLKDMIMRTNKNLPSGCEPVFVDTYAFATTNNVNTNVNSLNLTGSLISQIDQGWTVTGVTNTGDLSNTVNVTSLDYGDPYGLQWEVVPSTTSTMSGTFCIAGNNPMCNCTGVYIQGIYDSSTGTYNYTPTNELFLYGCANHSQTAADSYVGGTIDFNIYGANGGQGTFNITNADAIMLAFASHGAPVIKLTLDTNIPNTFSPPLVSGGPSTYTILQASGYAITAVEGGNPFWANGTVIVPGGSVNIASGWINIYDPSVAGGFDVSNFNIGDTIEVGIGGVVAGGGLGTTPYCVCEIDTTGANATTNNAIRVATPDPNNPGQCLNNCGVNGIPHYGMGSNYWILDGTFTTGTSIFANLDSTLNLALNTFDSLIWEGPRVLNFNHNNKITSLNIVDDMLYWTDGYYDSNNNLLGSEPKKINIPRSVDGTDFDGNKHTEFENPTRNITSGNYNSIAVREEHITVIKKSPLVSPTLKMLGQRSGDSYGTTRFTFDAGIQPGSEIELPIDSISSSDLNYIEGDSLFLRIDSGSSGVFPITVPHVRLVFNEFSASGDYLCTVVSISDVVPPTSTGFAVDLDKSYEKLYKLKFPRFAIRYKYQDGEYSTYGPFSEVAFMPGDYDYLPNTGYNLGMQNQLRELTLENIIPGNIPDGVVQVDILYKESNSPNVYIIDEIIPSDIYWTSNSYNIKEETIKSVLPENQLLRPWDNVPTKALAQEITGSRVVYGNYLQNYNLENLRPSFTTTLKPRKEESSLKSVKSIRDYQLGVVYCDRYNRQTPVLSDATAALPVSKLSSSTPSQVEIKPLNNPPSWATHHKFYIKDTYSEYHNLSLDRYFNAKDGNIWLSFPSNDRNKLDLDTSLHLKKKYKSDDPEFSTTVYKVIDIKNEAPEYIKTRKSILGRIGQDTANAGFKLFTLNDFVPVQGNSEFKIKVEALENTILENFHKRHNSPDTEAGVPTGGSPANNAPLFIRLIETDLSGNINGASTEYYEVDNVKKLKNNLQYHVKLRKPLESDASWVNTDPAQLQDPTFLLGGLNSPATTNQISLEIAQEIVQNKALFQGRFFAKILEDENIRESIIEQGEFADTTVVASANLSYLKDFAHEDPGMSGVWSGAYTDAVHEAAIDDFKANGWPWNNHAIGYHNYSNPLPDGKQVDSRAYWSYYVWQKIQAELDTAQSRWVIDEAFATGEEPFWGKMGFNRSAEHVSSAPNNMNSENNSNYNNQVSTHYGGFSLDSSNGFTRAINEASTSVGGVTIPFLGTLPLINGLAHGTNTNEYEYFSEGHGIKDNYIDISYVGPGRANFSNNPNNLSYMNQGVPNITEWTDIKNQTTQWKDFFRISGSNSNSNNTNDIGDSLDLEASKFARSLKIGNHVRFKDDNTGPGGNPRIYKITNVEKFYKFNYSQAPFDIDYPLCEHTRIYRNFIPGTNVKSPLHGNNYAAYFHKPHYNRRVTYRLYLEDIANGLSLSENISGGGYDPLNDGTDDLKIGGYATSGSMCGIEIVSQNYTFDNDVPFPENPAVFETEPKTSEGVDIFHEISDTIPLNLEGYGDDFAPIGSVATTVTGGISLGQGKVTNWSENVVTLDSVFVDDYINIGDLIYFTRPDGTYTTGVFNGLADPIIPGISSTSYSAKIVSDVQNNRIGLGWHNCYAFGNGVESNRIRDTFNSVFIDKGPKVSTTLSDGYKEEHRKYGLIYSGLYNSTSGVNNLNQFIAAEKITKDINPTYGSIQKLYSRNSDLVALCEDKVLRILANKDAVFNADGNPQLVATSNVLGQTIPFTGEYGISKNPESFASESYRAYFTDKVRGTVVRLSKDGLTPISSAGMKDWFRDNLKLSNKLVGSYDDKKSEYNITLHKDNPQTVTYREDVKGWVSFKTFIPENGLSCANEYYTYSGGNLWRHHEESVNRNTFYDTFRKTSVTVIINDMPGVVKTFHTLNYEGSQAKVEQVYSSSSTHDKYDIWDVTSWDGTFNGNGTPNYVTSLAEVNDPNYYNLTASAGWFVSIIKTNQEVGSINEFIEKEGKWFNYIKGKASWHN